MKSIVQKVFIGAVAILLTGLAAQAQVLTFYTSNGLKIDEVSSSGVVTAGWSGATNVNISGLAVDNSGGASNGVLYGTQVGGTIYKFATPSLNNTKATFATSGLTSIGMAVDSSGNVYQDYASIRKYSSTGTLLTTMTPPGMNTTDQPFAVSSAGNLFTADSTGGNINKYDSTGTTLLGSYAVAASLWGFAVDNTTGDVFASTSGSSIYKLSAAGVSSTFATVAGDGFKGLAYVNGHLYAVDNTHSTLVQFDSLGVSTIFATGLSTNSQYLAAAVPESQTWVLLGLGGGILALIRRHGRKTCR